MISAIDCVPSVLWQNDLALRDNEHNTTLRTHQRRATQYLGVSGRHLLVDDDLHALHGADDGLVVLVDSQVADARDGVATHLTQREITKQEGAFRQRLHT